MGTRVGNWLTVEQARKLLQALAVETVRGKRDRAIIALLVGCGLHRAEHVGLKTRDFQLRGEHSGPRRPEPCYTNNGLNPSRRLHPLIVLLT